MKSESGKALLKVGKQVGNELLKDAKGQAISMAHSHVDNLAKSVEKKTGVKVDTTDIKKSITEKAQQIKLGGSQLGGGFKQYGAGFPLQLVGSMAGKLVSNVAKSGVANQLVKAAQENASTIKKNMVAQAQQQAVQMAQQQIDKMASQVQQQTGLKVDTSGLKQKVQEKTTSFF
jgi:Fe2+ or Zn2+ uptake regulation protein